MLGRSKKTTTIGASAIIGVVCVQVGHLLQGIPVDWSSVITAIVGLGLIVARDDKEKDPS